RRWQLQEGVVALLRHELDRRPRAAAELGAATRPQLDGVHHGPERDVGERQAAARLDVGLRARLHRIADAEADRCEDVAARAVGILEERDARRAVRIVLDRLHDGSHAYLVATEVDHAIEPLVAAAPVPGRHATAIVPTTRLVQ